MGFKQRIYAVLCQQVPDGGIGKDNDVLYKPGELKGDMTRFKGLTMGTVVIMGRKTWDSLPENFRPLPYRENVIITKNPGLFKNNPDVYAFNSPLRALRWAESTFKKKHIVIIGGAEIYQQLFQYCDTIYATNVKGDRPADTFIKIPFLHTFATKQQGDVMYGKNGESFTFVDYYTEYANVFMRNCEERGA